MEKNTFSYEKQVELKSRKEYKDCMWLWNLVVFPLNISKFLPHTSSPALPPTQRADKLPDCGLSRKFDIWPNKT